MSSSSASKAARKSSLDTTSLLAQSRLFRNVPVETVRRAAERGALRELGPGQILFWQGERGDILYFVIEGELRSVRQDARGREQVLATHHAGAVLDLVSGVDSGPFYCTVIAERTRACCAWKSAFWTSYAGNLPTFSGMSDSAWPEPSATTRK